MLVDTNTVIRCFNEGKPLPKGDYIAPNDLYDEYKLAEDRHGRKIPNIEALSHTQGYDEAAYVKNYAKILNNYKDMSFARASGFADIAIMATVACLITDFDRKLPQTMLDLGVGNASKIVIITEDKSLRSELIKMFEGQISIYSYDEFIKL